MYNARDILLLAAEDAFEFEKWREAGPVIGDIDPEARAAEIAEFEALAIPMPAELDSLRRELEHAPKVREAIRNSAIAMRRSGRASASALVALGPQHLMHPSARMAFGWQGGGAPMMDPRLAAQFASMAAMAAGAAGAAGVAGAAGPVVAEPPIEEPRARSRRRERKIADAEVVAEHGPVAAELVDGYDDEADDEPDDDDLDDDDDDEPPPPKSRKREQARASAKRAGDGARKPKAKPARDWDDDDDADDDDTSFVAAPVPVGGTDRNTLIFGGIAGVAVIAMLYMMFNKDDPAPAAAVDPALVQQQQQQAPPPAPPPAPAIDPNTGLPYGQAPAPVATEPAPAPSSGRSGGGGGGGGGGGRGSGVRGSSSSTPSSPGAGVNPFADYKTPADPAGIGGGSAPAPAGGGAAAPAGGGAAAPAGGGAAAPAGGGAAAPAGGGAAAPAGGGTAPAGGEQPAGEAKPPEPVKPAEQPKPEDPLLTKSKMTPAIREAVVGRVGDLQACYQDAIVGKPDLAGKVVFVISLDQDGVVTKVDIGKDEVGYGVAKCSAKKIKRWNLPSAGIPIIFDLPFDFKS